MLEVKNISFAYENGIKILDDVSFELNQGEIVGLIAPSGYGKSTLARIMAGYMKPTCGKVLLDGLDVFEIQGFHPVQMAHQHPEKTVNIRWKNDRILNEGWNVSEEVKSAFGIEDWWLKKWPVELSGGELQRICLARILSPNTKYLLADEITTMIDAISTKELCDVLKTMVHKQNLGILFISHDKDLIYEISDRVLDLQELNCI